jgi:ArsR family transcriptional regulator, arsenate/arsenite/antimonite-responsive transcriptional repressor
MKTDSAVKALSALAQETRLSIFRLLVQAGELGIAAGEIAKKLSLANATLSFHLKELTYAGLITPRQESRYIFYVANYTAMNELLVFLTDNCCAGSSCGVKTPCCEEDA